MFLLTNSLTTHSSTSAGASPLTQLSRSGSISAKPREITHCSGPAGSNRSSLQSSQTQGAPLGCQQQSHFLPGSYAKKAKEVAEDQTACSRLCLWCGLTFIPGEEKIIIRSLPALLMATAMCLSVKTGFKKERK